MEKVFKVEVKGASGHIGDDLGVTEDQMREWFSEIAGKMLSKQMPEGHEGEPKHVTTEDVLDIIGEQEHGSKFLIVSGLSDFLRKYQLALKDFIRDMSRVDEPPVEAEVPVKE